jgi:PAS domain S-box-containing protein
MREVGDSNSERAADARYRAILASIAEAVISTDAQGCVDFMNSVAERLTGWSESEAQDKPLAEIFRVLDSEAQTPMENPGEQALHLGQVVALTDHTVLIARDGTQCAIAGSGSPIRDESGATMGVVLVFCDQSEERMAQKAMLQAGLYNRSLIEASLDPLVTIGAEGKITDVNEATTKVTGCPREELIGSDFSDYFTQPKKAREGYQRVFAEGQVTNYPLEVKHSDGRTTPVLYNAAVYQDEEGHVVGVFAAARDITERKRAEEEIRTLNAELEQRVRDRTAQLEASNQELEAFSYSVSHDLRTPLRAIDGFARILREDYAQHLDAEGKRVCSVIHDNVGNMSRLIDDLLMFSRLGRTEMSLSEIDMGAMASAVFHELTTPESRARIDFSVGSLPPAFADTTLMRQVWTNLLSNCIKFSSKRERATIQVGAEQMEGETVYTVQDNGAGFDMQYVHKLFGVFQRLHSTKEFEGTGVGLALVQRVIRRHAGRVWAEGEIDKGATIYFTIQPWGE